jgi:hypothetical protein
MFEAIALMTMLLGPTTCPAIVARSEEQVM